MSETLFTPEQANATLPLVRAIVTDVVELEARLVPLTRTYRALKERPDKPQVDLNETRRAIAALVAERDACAAELVQIGVHLGDAGRGICDFPSTLDGDPVFLCWELGEETVEYYHMRDEGFAGRRPMPVACPV